MIRSMRLILGPVVALGALVACGSFSGDGEPTPSPQAGVDGGPTDGGPPRPGCADGILYVTPDGKDTDDGCSPARAKKTIGAAIARVKGEALTGHEIHVCNGTYAETLTLDVPVSLRGGYSCNKFERTSAFGLTAFGADGKATGFDGLYVTQIVPTELSPFTLRIEGASVVSSVVIDGLTVTGPSKIAASAEISNAAIAVADGAAPTIENCDVKGGAYLGDVVHGSIAIGVLTKAAPIIRANRIVAGHGTATNYGSTAIDVVGASAQVSGNAIDGGDGTSPGIGAMGIHVMSPDKSFTLEGNHVWVSGTGTGVASVGIYTMGAAGPTATIRGNRLHPTASHCSSGVCFLFGIIAESMATSLDGNIVELGTVDSLGGGSANATRVGVSLRGLVNSRFVNNVIHGGVDNPSGNNNVNVGLRVEARGLPPGAPEIGDTLLVAHNTLFPGGPKYGTAFTLQLAGTKNITVLDNLLLAPSLATATLTALDVSNCVDAAHTPVVASFRNNAFVGDTVLASIDNCGSKPVLFTAPELNTEPSFAAEGGNLRVTTNCNLDAVTCAQDSTCGTNCPAVVIPTFSAAPTFGEALLFAAGWKLGTATPCLVKAGGISMDPPQDAAGVARTAKPSIGAYELDGVCP
jgi:hypothetical protein